MNNKLSNPFLWHFMQICDVGGSITVHAFGAYFGLAVSLMLRPTKDQNEAGKYEGPTYTSDMFAMVGTLFLWIYWPSFNSVLADGTGQERAILNTYLSLAAATGKHVFLIYCNMHITVLGRNVICCSSKYDISIYVLSAST